VDDVADPGLAQTVGLTAPRSEDGVKGQEECSHGLPQGSRSGLRAPAPKPPV